MAKIKIPWHIRYAAKRPADENITANNEGSPYLHRWHLIPKNRFINIYLHRFTGPDQRVMHDHPWISLAYTLQGYFDEVFCRASWLKKYGSHYRTQRRIYQGHWTYRNSTFLHYLDPGPDGAWTLFMTGPKLRGWGFATADGWKPWREVVFNAKSTERRDL